MKANYIIKQIAGTLLFFAIIFISAGKLFYWQGLIYISIGLIMITLNYTVFCIDAALLEERSKPGEGTKKWDKQILGITFIVTISMYIIAGLDSGRYNWSPDFNLILYFVGIVFTILGQLLFLIAQKQNEFFSSTVRIQTERNHRVIDKGLYNVVRHPAYLGSIIQSLGFPMLFGSCWSIIPVSILIFLFIIRTNLEDKTLNRELTGYADYSQKIRYKIIPFIW